MKIPVKQNDSRPSFHAWGPAGGARHQRRDSGRIGHPSPMDTRKSAVKREGSGGEKRSLGCFFSPVPVPVTEQKTTREPY